MPEISDLLLRFERILDKYSKKNEALIQIILDITKIKLKESNRCKSKKKRHGYR